MGGLKHNRPHNAKNKENADMTLRYDFLSELNEQTKETLNLQGGKLNISNHLYELPIEIQSLSLDKSIWLHAVEAEKKYKKNKFIFGIRVIINLNGTETGINVLIPHRNKNEELNLKFLDLRYQIRNSDYVRVTFPQLYVKSLSNRIDLYLWAYDFKIEKPEQADIPFPSLEI